MSNSYTIARSRVVAELFDDEVVIINLEQGTYYSLDGAGKALWQGLDAGYSIPALITYLAQCYSVAPMELEVAVRNVINQLSAEAIIEPCAEQPTTEALPIPSERSPFVAPQLRAYTDMQDLLMLDPIHDVDETGWPYARQG